MSAAPAIVLGIDVGGSKIAAGLVAFPEGRIDARKIIPTEPGRGGEPVLEDTLRLARELFAEAAADRREVSRIGLGVCELVDRAGTICSANSIAWLGLPVSERLSRLAPVVIEADVRAAARAEALFGAGRGFNIFLYVTVGTGISSCLMLEGSPYLGARGLTGTLASSPLPSGNDSADKNPVLTLEEIASGPALVARYNQGTAAPVQSAEAVLAAASAGDPRAIGIVRRANEALGGSVGLLVNLLDPEAVIIGGGLGLAGGFHWETLTDAIRSHIWSGLHRGLPIQPAATGPDAGVIGAAAAAWRTP